MHSPEECPLRRWDLPVCPCVPAREQWLYMNADALHSVKLGIEQAGRGELI